MTDAAASPVYLDGHATTPLDPRVLEAMLPALRDNFGNPASEQHMAGQRASLAVETAREELRELLHADAAGWDVVFTSGATEANNLALRGTLAAQIITAITEHRAVLDPLAALERDAAVEVVRLPVERDTGRLDPAAVEAAISPRTRLVSLMAANNEIGVRHDLATIGAITRARGVLLHTDATQAVGHVPIDLRDLPVDLLSLSAHKFHGPKGAGALLVRKGTKLQPMLHGGGQERGLRAGTLNVPAIVGLGAAAAIAQREMETGAARVGALRDRLLAGLRERLVDGVIVNGPPPGEWRLPTNLNISIEWIDGSMLLPRLAPRIAVSSGSACSGVAGASHVLRAIGRTSRQITASLRFGLGRFTTADDVDAAVDAVADVVSGLRAIDPLYELHREGVDVRALPGE